MTDTPNSTQLLEMAHREWKNRQERKGFNDEVAWVSGWISGYLTKADWKESIIEEEAFEHGWSMALESFTLKELVDELSKREFVETYIAQKAKIIIVVIK